MTTKYLLPCECGNQVTVDATQAGLTVECTCGKELQVPTMRGLANCERASEEVAPPTSTWGAAQGMLLLGISVLLLGLIGTIYTWQVAEFNENLDFTLRVDKAAHGKDVEAMSPAELWMEWKQMPRSLETMPVENNTPGLRAHEHMRDKYVERYRRFTWVGVAVCAIGLGFTIFGGVLISRRPRQI